MNTTSTSENDAPHHTKPWSSGWHSWLIFAAFALLLYFGNQRLQTYLGERALAMLDFPQLDLPQAIQQAKQENKLILADMSAIWCPSCRKLDSQVLSDPSVNTAIKERYIYVRIEYESEAGKAFQQQYQVRGFPTLLVLNSQGETLRKLLLTFDKNEFIRQL